jgi:hypothetical protein
MTKDKKLHIKKSNQFVLNRGQVEKLAKMANHFHEVEWFTLEENNISGIGPTVIVKFNLFNDNDKDIDTTVDITDVSTW